MRKSYALVLVALAFTVSACGGNGSSPTAPTNPTPGAVQWSTVGSLNFDPTVVSIGRSVQIDQMFTVRQVGITSEVTLEITRPDGVVNKEVATATSTTLGTSAFGFGYYPTGVGTYSVHTSVRQWVSDQSNNPEERTGSFQAVK